jgi:hypothetical protein
VLGGQVAPHHLVLVELVLLHIIHRPLFETAGTRLLAWGHVSARLLKACAAHEGNPPAPSLRCSVSL